MTDLLDVNVLVALAWPNHVHHGTAHQWFRRRGPEPWATTPITESGFVRVSSNRAALPTAVAPAEALALLERMRLVAGHRFLPDDVELVVGTGAGGMVDRERVVTHGLVADAHLLALARRHGARLATLDRGAAALASPDVADVVLVGAPPVPPGAG
ncbi:MAG: TA system VapC family ribonuclease toxin [Acidimicrobiales bacterium]